MSNFFPYMGPYSTRLGPQESLQYCLAWTVACAPQANVSGMLVFTAMNAAATSGQY